MSSASFDGIKGFLEGMLFMRRDLPEQKKLRGFRYSSIEDFILTLGRQWALRPKLPRGVRKGRLGECYTNAYRLASTQPTDYAYVEGYAAGYAGVPVMHAWCIDRSGIVVDNTWSTKPLQGTDYFGVAFNLDYVNRVMLRTKKYGVICSWEDEFRFLKDDPAQIVHPTWQSTHSQHTEATRNGK